MRRKRKRGPLNKLSVSVQSNMIGNLGALFLAAVYKTVRWKRNDLEKLRSRNPFIAAFWHGRQLMLAPLFGSAMEKNSTAVLISAHSDGRMVARAIRWFGLDSVTGSSTEGGVGAFRDMISILEAGKNIAITPDGPRGPCYKAKLGIIRLARITGLPVYPMTFATTRFWQFSSWDRMILPKPLSSGVCLVDDPYIVPPNGDEMFHQVELEKRLNELAAKAEALLRT